jgi:haloacetate dehalogenase
VAGFEYTTVAAGGTTYRPGVAGDGPAVLLLHGFPQTHYCWRDVAPGLAGRTVVVCDLKGYGSTRAAPGGPRGEGYSNRERAAELVEVMGALGFLRFAVVGHDRGARVAYRMALDHPGAVERLAVLNIVPTADQFERMAADAALDYWPWFLLAQPAPFPERVVGASAEFVVRDVLRSWAASPDVIGAEPYVSAFNVDGVCADYRASFISTGRWTRRIGAAGAGSSARCWSTGARRRPRCPTARCRSGAAGPTTCRAARWRPGTSSRRRRRGRCSRR